MMWKKGVQDAFASQWTSLQETAEPPAWHACEDSVPPFLMAWAPTHARQRQEGR